MKVACVQWNVEFREPSRNADRICGFLPHLASKGVQLAVFPEAFLTGYCVRSRDEAASIAIPKSHSSLLAIQRASDATGVLVIVGFAEEDGGRLFNTAALFEPGDPPHYFRKAHLPELGLDKHVEAGDDLAVFNTALGKIAVLICFDLRHPEAMRAVALKGAELVALPTNWPIGADVSADHTVITRAAENRVFVAACNRVGSENGFGFIGKSKIVAPSGQVLASAGDSEEVIEAEIDLSEARNKRHTIIQGEYEMTVFESRRPELYGVITDKPSHP